MDITGYDVGVMNSHFGWPLDFVTGAVTVGSFLVTVAAASGANTLQTYSTSTYAVGQYISGTGIQSGTTITAINNTTDVITISKTTNAIIPVNTYLVVAQTSTALSAVGIRLSTGANNVVVIGNSFSYIAPQNAISLNGASGTLIVNNNPGANHFSGAGTFDSFQGSGTTVNFSSNIAVFMQGYADATSTTYLQLNAGPSTGPTISAGGATNVNINLYAPGTGYVNITSPLVVASNLTVTGYVNITSGLTVSGGINSTAIGATTASTGAFTTLTSSGAATLSSLAVTSGTTIGGTLGVTGILTTSGHLFGSVVGSSNTDLTKHISLFGSGWGFNVTGSQLNYVVPTSGGHHFNINGTDSFVITSSGAAVTGTLTVGTYNVLTTNTYNTYAPSLTGTGASGTWGISVTGNAANVTAYPLNQSVSTTSSPVFTNVTAASGTINAKSIVAGNSTTQGTMALNGATAQSKWLGYQNTGVDRFQIAIDGSASNQATGIWAASTAYALGVVINNGSNAYVVTTAGTSASSGGPTGTGTGIADGTVVWNYSGVANSGDNYVVWLWDDPRQNRTTPFQITRATKAVTVTYGLTVSAPTVISDSSTSGTSSLAISATSNANGVGIALTGNGSTTPTKYIRVNNGTLQILNSAYSTVIWSMSDAGVGSAAGAWTFAASGTGLSVTNNATIGGTLTVTGATTHTGLVTVSSLSAATSSMNIGTSNGVAFSFYAAPSATNHLGINAAASGGNVQITAASSSDTNVNIQLSPLGTGSVIVSGPLTAGNISASGTLNVAGNTTLAGLTVANVLFTSTNGVFSSSYGTMFQSYAGSGSTTYLQLNAGPSTGPTISAGGGTNVNINLYAPGTGYVNITSPLVVASNLTVTGYVNITSGLTVSGGINSTAIGASGPSTGNFTTVSASSLNITGNATVSGSLTLASIQGTPIGSTTPSTGNFSALTVAGVGLNIATIAALRLVSSAGNGVVYVQGYASTQDGGEGQFWYNSADTTTADNGGTIIVDGGGRRWYRFTPPGRVNARHFGAKYDGSTNDTTAHLNAATWAAANGLVLELPAGNTVLTTINFPAVTAIIGQGAGITNITLLVASYTASTGILNFSNPVQLRGFSIFCNNVAFDQVFPLNFSSITGTVDVRDVNISGRYYFGVRFDTIGQLVVKNMLLNATSSTSCIPFYAHVISDGDISSIYISGQVSSHNMQVANSINTRVYSCHIESANSSGFGISFDGNTGCQMAFNECHNSGPEAFEMTLCTDCSITDSYAYWDASIGHDFASSMESCIRCNIDRNHFYNSYKGAVGIAADNNPSIGNRANGNYATNCGTRAQAAGAGYLDTSVFVIYTSSSGNFSNTDNEFVGNIITTDSGNGVSYGYLEGPSGTGVLQNTKVKGATFIGGGSVSVPYNISQTGSYVWMDQYVAWVPTVGSGSGTVTTFGTVVGRYIQEGQKVTAHLQIPIITNGSGGSSITSTLPKAIYSASAINFVGVGREFSLSGKELAVTLSGSTLFIYNYDNSYPGGNGATLAISFTFEMP